MGGVTDGMAGGQGDDDNDNETDLPMHLLAIFRSREKKAVEWVRDSVRALEAKLYRSDEYIYKRMRMSPASFEELLKRVHRVALFNIRSRTASAAACDHGYHLAG